MNAGCNIADDITNDDIKIWIDYSYLFNSIIL